LCKRREYNAETPPATVYIYTVHTFKVETFLLENASRCCVFPITYTARTVSSLRSVILHLIRRCFRIVRVAGINKNTYFGTARYNMYSYSRQEEKNRYKSSLRITRYDHASVLIFYTNGLTCAVRGSVQLGLG
jgi:hypothetical protein